MICTRLVDEFAGAAGAETQPGAGGDHRLADDGAQGGAAFGLCYP